MGNKKINSVYILSSIIFLVIAPFSFAQTNNFNLQDALDYGIQHSPYMTIVDNQLAIGKYDTREAYSSYLPQINASAEHDYNAKLPVTVIPGGFLGPEEIRMKMGLAHSNSIVAQLEQKLYDQKAIFGLKAIDGLKKKASLTSQETLESFIYNTAMAYYQVLTIDQKVKLLKANETQYATLVKILKLQYQKGVVKEIDYNRVQVAYNNMSSQLNQIKTARKVALNQLKVLIGMPIKEDLVIADPKKLLNSISLPKEDSINISNRLDYKMDQLIYNLQIINTKAMKYAFLPKLSFFAQYGSNSFSDEFRESFQKFNDFSTIGLKLTIPIFNGLQVNTAYHKQKIQLENLEAQNKIQKEGYKIEYLNAQTSLQEAYTSFKTNQRNLTLAKEVYDVTTLSYQSGASTLSDFLNSDYNYKEAQNNYTSAMIRLLTSRLDFEKAKGNLSNYLNINK